jgi:Bacteriophage HK97-gp10, putative tail-component
MAISVQVRGFAELAAGTRILAGHIDHAVPAAFLGVADQVAGQVNVPRRTGALAASVEGRETGDGASVLMGDGVPYAQFVEYGGRGHPHSPQGNYLYPAAIEAEALLVTAGEKVAEQEIGRMRWPTP